MGKKPSPPTSRPDRDASHRDRGTSHRDPDATRPDRSSSPFAALAALRDRLPPGQPPAAGPTAGDSVAGAPAGRPTRSSQERRGPGRAVVRYQRKGRGGKEVTLVEQLGLSDSDLEAWCRELKRALGCGGAVENGSIALAGDQRRRVRSLLEDRGVRRISVG
jgi:translation initiation factor 1